MKKWMILLLVLTLSACGGSPNGSEEGESGNSTSEAAAQEVNLVAQDILYEEDALGGVAGQPIEVQFTNKGALAHDFTIKEIPLQQEVEARGHEPHGSEAAVHLHLESGETGSVTFTPTEAGTYTYECTVPGHKEAGMVGTLSIAEAAQ